MALQFNISEVNSSMFGGVVPLAGGAAGFLGLGGGTFFSGSGFLGTTGTLKILFCFTILVSQIQRQWV